MNESLVKYLAGLCDADGSLSFNFKNEAHRPDHHFVVLRMTLASSDAVDKVGFVESLPSLTGFGSVSRYGVNKQFITWTVNRRADVEMLLPRIIKHMVIKGQHWNWLLETWRKLRTGQATISTDERDSLVATSKESRRTKAGPLKPKNHPSWTWLAGYLDGDGTYTYRKHGPSWHMAVSAVAHKNDMVVLDFLHKSFGGHIVGQGQAEDVFVWKRSMGYSNRDFAIDFLSKIARHVRLKRPKVEQMIHHHRQRLSVPGVEKKFCKIDDCGRDAHGHGMCSMHYLRWYRNNAEAAQATV